jgi:hypothetical protein
MVSFGSLKIPPLLPLPKGGDFLLAIVGGKWPLLFPKNYAVITRYGNNFSEL